MTVYANLERALAMVEASKGSYLLFATESEDEKAKQVFQDMASDMEGVTAPFWVNCTLRSLVDIRIRVFLR